MVGNDVAVKGQAAEEAYIPTRLNVREADPKKIIYLCIAEKESGLTRHR